MEIRTQVAEEHQRDLEEVDEASKRFVLKEMVAAFSQINNMQIIWLQRLAK